MPSNYISKHGELTKSESNKILFPPSQLGKGDLGWVLVPGYNSYSPELVVSIYDAPVSVTAGQKRGFEEIP